MLANKKTPAIYHYFGWLQESFPDPFVHHARTLPWTCLITMAVPGDCWTVSDLGCCHRHDPHPLIWLPLTPNLPHPHRRAQRPGLLAGRVAITGSPLFSLFGCHGTAPRWAVAALPAPPSLPAASPPALREHPMVAASWQSLAVKQSANTAVCWAPGDAYGCFYYR